jgi:hypothetical protein
MKGHYSPAECIGARKEWMEGDFAHVSTSYAERQNHSMRLHMRRFTRLTNAFSKKFENHVHMVALYRVFYNRTHISQDAVGDARMALAFGIRLWSMNEFAEPSRRRPITSA